MERTLDNGLRDFLLGPFAKDFGQTFDPNLEGVFKTQEDL